MSRDRKVKILLLLTIVLMIGGFSALIDTVLKECDPYRFPIGSVRTLEFFEKEVLVSSRPAPRGGSCQTKVQDKDGNLYWVFSNLLKEK